MINYSNTRNNGGDDFVIERERTVLDAVWSLVIFELGYGGIVTQIDDQSMTIVTRVLAATDTTVFVGTKEEMEPLLKAVYFHNQLKPNIEEVIDFCHKISNGKAALVAWSAGLVSGGILKGRRKLQAIVMLAMGIEDEETIKYVVENVAEDEVEAVVDLLCQGATLDDIKNLVSS